MQIKITDITPLLKEGYVAMDKCGEWYWYNKEPYIEGSVWQRTDIESACESFKDFGCLQDIEPAEDWKQSLIIIKGAKQ